MKMNGLKFVKLEKILPFDLFIVKKEIRSNFNHQVMERDNSTCVICGNKKDLTVHHILDRSLFCTFEQAYKIDNGATICPKCHWLAETTYITCQEIREKANITNIVLPDGLSSNFKYDKWGNIILTSIKNDGIIEDDRLKGPLANSEQMKKAMTTIGTIINLKDDHFKYLAFEFKIDQI